MSAREIVRGETVLDVTKTTIGGEPAATFGTVRHRNGYDPLESAALYGYHATTDWGALADEDGIHVFSSRWLSEGNWYQFPVIAWDQFTPDQPILQALRPEGLIERRLSRLATQWREPTDFLAPVDDALVDRLDKWRDQALRYAASAAGVDEHLQTFYAQMFVLRTIEDRNLQKDLPTAESILSGSDQIDIDQWNRLLALAREYVGSELFENDVLPGIPQHVVAGVIRDLYTPHALPGRRRARYDFSWIDADVLGAAYEKYLASVLQPTAPPPQVDLFLSVERGVERHSVRKASGAYYTPKFITNFLAEKTVGDFCAANEAGTLPHIVDFSCGSGSFLVAAANSLLRRLKAIDNTRPWARELIDGGHIAGIDVDAKAVTTARLHLWQRLIEEPDALPLPNLSNVIIVANGLDRTSWGELNRRYDIVLGNPPFLATNLVPSREPLEENFATARGRYDYSSLFVEQALNVLSSSGKLGLVVPNRLFRNRSGGPCRAQLTARGSLLTLVDFGTTRPFDADAYVGCIIARLRGPAEVAPERVRVIEVRSLESDFLADTLLTSDATGTSTDSRILKVFDARHPAGDLPWALLSRSEQLSRVLLEEVSVRLDTIASIPQGIRTGGNDLFLFDVLSDEGGELCRVQNGLGDVDIIETALLEPVVYGSRVRRFEEVNPEQRLLYPYRDNKPLSEDELAESYPSAWAYFLRNREILSARSSLKKSNGAFYELVWPRDENWLRRPKLLIRDLAPSTAFAIDPMGKVFLVGGTAVVPQDSDIIYPLLAYLNSSPVNLLVKQNTSQFRGDFQKFEPQHIQSIPVLKSLLEDGSFSEKLGDIAINISRATIREESTVELQMELDSLVVKAAEDCGVSLES